MQAKFERTQRANTLTGLALTGLVLVGAAFLGRSPAKADPPDPPGQGGTAGQFVFSALLPVFSNGGNTDSNCVAPPGGAADLDTATGTDRIVTVSNCNVAIFEKDGDLINRSRTRFNPDQSGSAGLFTPENVDPINRIIDPDTLYDTRADRFWIIAIERPDTSPEIFDEGWLHVAVSKDSTPDDFSSTHWWKYSFDLHVVSEPFEGLAHRGTLAVDDDVMTVCMLDTPPPPQGFDDWRDVIFIADKSDLEGGSQPTPVFIPLHGLAATAGHACAVEYGDTSNSDPQFFVGPADPPETVRTTVQDEMRLSCVYFDTSVWQFATTTVELPEPAEYLGLSVDGAPQPNSHEAGLVGSFVWHAVYTAENRIWCTHHVQTTGNADLQPIVRWYEFDTNSWPFSNNPPELVQWGEIDLQNENPSWSCYDPSIAVDLDGNMMLTWTQSGPDDDPPQFLKTVRGFRCAGETLGELTDVADVEQCNRSLNLAQADYGGTTIDPVDPGKFWSHNMLIESNTQVSTRWEARVALLEIDCPESRRVPGSRPGFRGGPGRAPRHARPPIAETLTDTRPLLFPFTGPTDAARMWLRGAPYRSGECYPDCDAASGVGVLDVFDMLCFQNRYEASDPYACDCEIATGNGVCDIFDFLCFQNAFAAGCP